MNTDDLPLFSNVKVTSELCPMVRRYDRSTSVQAAKDLKSHLSQLQQKVLGCFMERGPMTDEELESLFPKCAPGTVRKRRVELYQKGKLIEDGVARNRRRRLMTIWRIPDYSG
jgi:hypothetical protein